MICDLHHGVEIIINGHYIGVSILQTPIGVLNVLGPFSHGYLMIGLQGNFLQSAFGEIDILERVVTHDGDQAYGLTLGVPKRYAHVGIYVHLDQKIIVWEDDLDARGVNT